MDLSSIGGLISGLVTGIGGSSKIDLRPLFDTIKSAGENERSLIAQLPLDLQPMYEQYKASLGESGAALRAETKDIGQSLLDKTTALYGPDSPATQATLAALKQQDYSTLPGTLTNLKAQLAGSGGLSTGGASRAITQAVLAPAAQYSQQAANVQGQQLTEQQKNVQNALNKIAQMDDQTANTLFGMTTAEAADILQYGRQDLKAQLAQLIAQTNTQTSQMLATQGIVANQNYQNEIANKAQQDALINALVNTGVSAVGDMANAADTGSDSSSSTGYNPKTMSTPSGENTNPELYGIVNR